MTKNYKILLGKKIKKLRITKKITQEELAELVNRSKNHISKIELGNANPPLELLIDIANALSVNLHELFNFYNFKNWNVDIKKEFEDVLLNSSEKHLRILYELHNKLNSENIF